MTEPILTLSAAYDALPEPMACCRERVLLYCNPVFQDQFPECIMGDPMPETWGELSAPASGSVEGWQFVSWAWEDCLILRLFQADSQPLIRNCRLPLLAARIREPLVSLTYAQEHIEDYLSVFQQKQTDLDFAKINKQRLRLLRLIHALEIAGLAPDERPAEFHPAPAGLNLLLSDTFKQLKNLLPKVDWQLDLHCCKERLFADCDDILVQTQIYHLVANAILANPKHSGHLDLRLERRGNVAVISLSDDGRGMSQRQLERAMDPRRGFGDLQDAMDGMGVGLRACNTIARLHGGALVLSNRTTHGLRASISLPLCQPLPRSQDEFRMPRMVDGDFHGVALVLRELSDILPAECFYTFAL